MVAVVVAMVVLCSGNSCGGNVVGGKTRAVVEEATAKVY